MQIDTKEYIDVNYIHIIGSTIKGFQSVKRNVWVGRCPVCGDSKKHRAKKRFYIYGRKGSFFVYCHNCLLSHTLWKYLELYRPDLFPEYKRETLFDSLNSGPRKRRDDSQTVLEKLGSTRAPLKSELAGTVPCSSLSDDHQAIRYLKDRCFSDDMISRLCYAEDFLVTAQSVDSTLENKQALKAPRIVIPFRDREGNIAMIQGRSLNPKDNLKYLSIKAHDDIEKVYGRSEVDYEKTVYCVEGPLDSMFVDNCLATCDANLTKVEDADTYIWDNEPRSRDICKFMEGAIEDGNRLVIWPFSPDIKIDINDLIKKGISRQKLMSIIHENTYHGIRAKAAFMRWKRI